MAKTYDTDCDGTHAMVQQVTIVQIDATTVTYSTRSASTSGSDGALLRTFVSPLSEVWSEQIPGAPAPVEMKPGAMGNLFLSKAGWEATTSDGHPIYGTGTDLIVFKYPWCGATPRILSNLTVVPSSIVVRGHLAGRTEFFELELIGTEAAEAAETQDLRWNGAAHLQLQLTSQGAARLGLAGGAQAVQVWPTRMIVRGRPAADLSVAGEVDLLDSELAGQIQHVAFARRDAPVTLTLTLDGVSAFHVEPQRRAS
ncbi:MAG TPA: hypothetical protein VH165_29390 [Kofleriaceae bacterium]|nr:hypothetical protein [Kofleriaceae bacterium]